ncbi:GNAT family N-acetyltransferase [Chroococcus sp. FPU101]|uniref:GNAT family N-acetyltransferase n=1 Tax=Chroococcus sp. FPU101 TaxID=1974212 RepID=UPI001A90A8BE|nr:GNAT family N-acetyltransferase [Chroococcus sp. FPU101]GFE69458.1 hypothetical protein CFPU101_20680 [Chroococcus sp. FPU101]
MYLSLNTERLQLKAVTENELYVFHEVLVDPFVRKYLCDDKILSLAQAQEFINVSQKNFDEQQFGLWLMYTKSTHELIGFVGFWYFFDEPQPQLLYALLPNATKKGYATEAVSYLIQYGFKQLGYKYLMASCDEPNFESRKLAERLGMKLVERRDVNEKPLLFFRIDQKV